MNERDFGSGTSKKMLGPRPKKGKEQRDEDLVLFREMLKQQERANGISLLGPDSVEFEANGNYQFYRQSSGRKTNEFLPDSGKHDYDWLKTPPATPLFPSLEMEAGINASEFAVQRELPIFQPMSRLSGNSVSSAKPSSIGKSKSPKPNPVTENLLVVPNVNLKPVRTSVTPPEPKPSGTKFKNTTTLITQKGNPQMGTSTKTTSTTGTTSRLSSKPTNQLQKQQQKKLENPNQSFLATNLSKSMQTEVYEPKTSKPKSRAVSPLVRSNLNLAGFSNETPTNLKTDRSLSAMRDRSVNRMRNSETTPLKRENNTMKTQTRSASVSSIRTVEPIKESGKMKMASVGGSGTQILGSRMVDRLMNARKSNTTAAVATTTTRTVQDKDMRTKPINMRASLNEGSGFGRRMAKSSLDGAFKHMELK